jgi:DNA repair protein RecN (Recombination protein N)
VLKSLRVSNLAVIEKAEASFSKDLNVITGETGSGKSVFMSALELVLGARADASIVRKDAKEAEIEAQFDEHTIRRTITGLGKSRAWIDDESVSIAELKEFSAGMVDMHGPTANELVLSESFQRDVLDDFAKIDLSQYAEAFGKYDSCRREIEELKSIEVDEDELDLLRYQIAEIESSHLELEDESIEERHRIASNSYKIIENASFVTDALSGDNSPMEVLCQLSGKIDSITKYLPAAKQWQDKLQSVIIDIQELSRTVADEVSSLGGESESLDELDDRLTLINKLKRKYLKTVVSDGSSIKKLLDILEVKKSQLEKKESVDVRIDALCADLTKLEKTLLEKGSEITKSRKEKAKVFAEAITAEIRSLGMSKATFDVLVEQSSPGPFGCDRIVFMFGPNIGEISKPLSAIASSGEKARVMLAIKLVLSVSGSLSPAVLVFDEIDANVGGETAKIIGEKLLRTSKNVQVVAITHLPQTAAFADNHLALVKSSDALRTRTVVKSLSRKERVDELARMLGGEKLTSVVHKHAEELLLLKERLKNEEN